MLRVGGALPRPFFINIFDDLPLICANFLCVNSRKLAGEQFQQFVRGGYGMTNVLKLRGITKRFPGVIANNKVDITLREGKILALLGENGAGKTTLMNILYGLYKPDEGKIIVRGQEVEVHGPNDAIARGIGMVHQHFMLIPVMTVTENVMLGVEPTRNRLFLDKEKVAARIREISDQYG